MIETCRQTPDYHQQHIFAQQQPIYDIGKLKAILVSEIRDSAIVNIPKSQLINELKYILQSVDSRNNFQLSFAIKKKYLESFKALAESLVMVVPSDLFTLQNRQKFLLALIKRVFEPLERPDSGQLVVELTFGLASLLFTLVYNLRLVVEQTQKSQWLSDNVAALGIHTNQQRSSLLNLSSLSFLLEKVVDYLLNSCNFLFFFKF